jgi:aspartyl-tRNA(Asn)/glutamyl-tRNA(Gln) amidotransferase subunit A
LRFVLTDIANMTPQNPKIIARPTLQNMPDDLVATHQRLELGALTASAALERAIENAQSAVGRAAFVETRFDDAREVTRQADAVSAPARPSRLGGLPFSVKDLFDVAGQATRAGSRVLAGSAPALLDSPAVARLKAAGGAMMGRTHMVEFAFSGVGTNPHAATPAAWDGRFGRPAGSPGAPRIPGGSSSGAAVSVATGAAFIGLGSDTGGSIRIPAALNGIVGFKSTARRVPTAGAVPLSTTLDTVCAVTRSVRDAIVAHEILAARRVVRSPAPLSAYRFAVAQASMLEGLDTTVMRAFQRSLKILRDAGATVNEIPLEEIRDLGAIQSTGGFSAAESFAWHRTLLETRAGDYDPRVAARIQRGAAMKAHEYIELMATRRHWISRVEAALQGFDAVLSPTLPIVGPSIASVAPADGIDAAADAARDAEFFRVNALLLRNTSVVNMLDGCALSVPCHTADELPVGLMVWHGAMRDDVVLGAGLRIEELLQIQ